MSYYILNRENIAPYLDAIDRVKEYLRLESITHDNIDIDEIGDGNLNFVFIIKSRADSSKAVILKQAVPYLRCIGEEFPLSKERMTFEIRALQSYYRQTPKLTPEIYDANEQMSAIIMQYLDKHIIMRKGMIAQTIYPNFSEHISTFLAHNLFATSSLSMSSTAKRALMDRFNSNTELCKLTEDFVFTFAFMPNETNDEYANGNPIAEALFDDMEFKKAILSLKYKFMTQSDALLHGDLHTGSIMLDSDETFIIDPEFAFVGPFGFDIGALMGNLVMSYTSHLALGSLESYREWILTTIVEIWERFELKFLDLWRGTHDSALITEGYIDELELDEYRAEFMLGILRDSIGFAGSKMARRMFGVAGVEDIRAIEDTAIRDSAIEQTLRIAKIFVKTHTEIGSIDEVIRIIKNER